jgi:hypothetical protein
VKLAVETTTTKQQPKNNTVLTIAAPTTASTTTVVCVSNKNISYSEELRPSLTTASVCQKKVSAPMSALQ